ncbi:MAG TPA: Ig-like domain repeat protein [Bryobacteraceae bacterium]
MVSLSRRQSRRFFGPAAFAGICSLVIPIAAAAAVAPLIQTPSAVTQGVAQLVSHYTPTDKLRFTIALKPPSVEEQDEFIEQLYTKGSPNFHKFLTAEQWNARFAPLAADEQAIVDWATANGLTVTERYSHRLTISLEGTTDQIEKAFGVRINNYQLGALSFYSNDRDPVIPPQLTHAIQSVMGLNSKAQLLPKVTRRRISNEQPKYVPGPAFAESGHASHDGDRAKLPAALEASHAAHEAVNAANPRPDFTNGLLDPTDIYSREAYNWEALNRQGHCCNPNHGSDSPPEASIAIATAYAIDPNDITGFHNTYPYLADHWTTYNIDGTPQCPANDSACNIETTLDFEWATAMANSFGAAADTAHVHIYQGVNPNFGTFTHVLSRILSDNKVRIVSMSWGCAESDCWDGGDMNALHNVFNAMVSQGYSIVVSSGDNGATASEGAGRDCAHKLAVDYPGSDPDVVSAGGTQLGLLSNDTFSSEPAWQGDTFTGACSENLGGSGGGLSAVWPVPSYQSGMGNSMRSVPDISLNAITFQNFFFQGSLQGAGGTSIVAPELAGFFAQENAYLLAIGIGCGADHTQTCAPMGLPNPAIYTLGKFPLFAAHYPYYDITSGCNSNDVTIAFNTGSYCAQGGYDMVTGWGAANMLQLAWGINSYFAGDFLAPTATFLSLGVSPGAWSKTDQTISWTVTDVGHDVFLPIGVAGFSAAWDTTPSDITDRGLGSISLNNGPQFPSSTAGSLSLSAAGQGCHQANVRAWDNGGTTAVLQSASYCFDSVPPATIATLGGTLKNGIYTSNVTVTLIASDATSGVAGKFYSLDGRTFLTYSAPFILSAPGTYTLRYYSTDVAGNADTTHIVTFTVKSATTVTNVATSLNPSAFGRSVTFTAKVTAAVGGTPTGMVTFKDGSAILGSSALSGGQATFATAALNAGSHAITAAYAGSGSDLASTSAPITETVNKAATTTSVSSSLNASTFGKPVTFTASVVSVSGGGPIGGTVTFRDGSATLGSAGVNATTGKAMFATSVLTAGNHSITAVYSGGVNRAGSNSAVLTETVNRAATTTSLSSSLNPSIYEKAVTFTATIVPASGSGPIGGTVTFKDGGTTLAATPVSGATGKATLTTSALLAGSHSITATYNGDANRLMSNSAAITETVNKGTTKTTLSSSANPSSHGAAVTFTAAIIPEFGGRPIGGTVTFKDGAMTLGTADIDKTTAKATFATSALTAGNHSITATYGGAPNRLGSTSPALIQVVK